MKGQIGENGMLPADASDQTKPPPQGDGGSVVWDEAYLVKHLLENVTFFAVLSDIEPANFVVFGHSKSHRRIQHFADH